MAAGGGLPHSPHLLPPVRLPALPGSPEVESYAIPFGWLAMGGIVGAAFLVRIAIEIRPVGIQNLMEWLLETVEGVVRGVLGEATDRWLPLLAAMFLFILTSNLIGLIPGCMSPTASWHTNLAIALVVAAASQWAGIRAQGIVGYLKHFAPPDCPWWLKWTLMWWMWPLIHGLEQVVRPVSLTMRLFGNIYAKEILLLMLAFCGASFLFDRDVFVQCLSGLPLLLRPAIILLGTLVSIVQAAVFTILAAVYLALASEGGHGGESAAASGVATGH